MVDHTDIADPNSICLPHVDAVIMFCMEIGSTRNGVALVTTKTIRYNDDNNNE
jgi:hypothetical protein